MLWKEIQKDFQTNIYSQFAILGFVEFYSSHYS